MLIPDINQKFYIVLFTFFGRKRKTLNSGKEHIHTDQLLKNYFEGKPQNDFSSKI